MHKGRSIALDGHTDVGTVCVPSKDNVVLYCVDPSLFCPVLCVHFLPFPIHSNKVQAPASIVGVPAKVCCTLHTQPCSTSCRV